MNELRIYGASDDLIEIEGSIKEEFNVWGNDSGGFVTFLAISDGTVLKVRYDEDGIWRFTPVVVGSSDVSFKLGVDDRRHSDIVTMTGENITWVALATDIAR